MSGRLPPALLGGAQESVVLILEGFLTVSQGLRTCIRVLRGAETEKHRTSSRVCRAEGLCAFLDKDRLVEELRCSRGATLSGPWERAPENWGHLLWFLPPAHLPALGPRGHCAGSRSIPPRSPPSPIAVPAEGLMERGSPSFTRPGHLPSRQPHLLGMRGKHFKAGKGRKARYTRLGGEA